MALTEVIIAKAGGIAVERRLLSTSNPSHSTLPLGIEVWRGTAACAHGVGAVADVVVAAAADQLDGLVDLPHHLLERRDL